MHLIREMILEDIPQVSEIEHEAFPPPWPTTNFRRELTSDGLTHYLVAYRKATNDRNASLDEARRDARIQPSAYDRLRSGLVRFLRGETEEHEYREFVLGFAGVWFAADEGHLSTIAVRETHRKQGVGEHLLFAVINLAYQHGIRHLTLEVRVSNEAAKRLYRKFGFDEMSLRKGYYTDNREDAVIMTTSDISSPEFRENLKNMAEDYSRRSGQHIPVG
ncbi:MAG: ribosomal protein S18-alanine N-acetyltransferase [Dehalococcoidia bacterium]|nr:ribosomal protein S18-alanine N-acetyltransferase [Dehalococcoidia bacterium]